MCVSQYVYPLLNNVRSPVRDRHWTVTLLALLDAAAIRLTAVGGAKNTDLVRVLAQGADTFHALKLSEISRTQGGIFEGAMLTWAIEEELMAAADDTPVPDAGITRDEWDQALDFMAAHGVELLPDREASWKAFCRARAHYMRPGESLRRWRANARAISVAGSSSISSLQVQQRLCPWWPATRRQRSGGYPQTRPPRARTLRCCSE